jgi:cell division protein FtsI/penicillin-binding protein 2
MNINASISRLTYAFIMLFVAISLVMVNIQVFQAPQLQASGYNPRHCLPDAQPVRGNIYDRHGTLLVYTVRDDNALCGYRRVYTQAAVNAGLAPLIGYFSYRYGASGVEAFYDDVLSGATGGNAVQSAGEQLQNAYNQLLHKQVVGSDIYLTIDLQLQQDAEALYNQDAITGGVCQTPGSDPPGSVVVEDPNTGEILALVSRPFYDPNQINDDNTTNADAYWNQLSHSTNDPLLDRPAQGLYVPGSTFKTVTLAAGLDSGQFTLDSTFTKDQAVYFHVPQGKTVTWADYLAGGWNGVNVPFPMSVEQGYAFSDNVVFARVAYQVSADTWLGYVRRFGIATPGTAVTPVPFDAASNQSRAFTPGADFNGDLLADSGFGQGQLLISPLTMAEVTSAAAAGGNLYVPHVLYAEAPHGTAAAQAVANVTQRQLYSGAQEPIIQSATAAAIRHAMRAVVEGGTAYYTSTQLAQSPALEGGKSGSGQVGNNQSPQTWWISLAPDDAAAGGGPAKLVVVVMKEHSGEGSCQIFVADDIYRCAAADPGLAYLQWGNLGSCPVRRQG